MHSLDGGNRVIYVGTFSKVLFPALQLGFLVVPEQIAKPFATARAALDLQPPILRRSLSWKHSCARDISRRTCGACAPAYYERQLSLIDAIRKQLSSMLSVAVNSAGMHLLAHLTPDARRKFTDREASQRAAAHHVIAPALSDFYTDQRDGGALVLGYAAVPERALIQAVQRMARALEG